MASACGLWFALLVLYFCCMECLGFVVLWPCQLGLGPVDLLARPTAGVRVGRSGLLEPRAWVEVGPSREFLGASV
jgi:hypothetical protein